MRVLVVSKSLCGNVSNQVQYNNTIPPLNITPTYLQHNITLLIPIVILPYHTRLQMKFSFFLPNLR